MGRLPVRCELHRRRRAAQAERRRKSSLRVVAAGELAPEPPPAEPAPSSEPVRSLVATLRAELDALASSHPLVETLSGVALDLVGRIEGALDPRDRVALVKELRATLAELAEHEEVEPDDLFGSVAAPVVIAKEA